MAYEQFSYSIQLDLRECPCLIIGGGKVAVRKAESLLAAGAIVTVVAPEPDPRLIKLSATRPGLTLKKRLFQPGDTRNMFLVITATDNAEVNREAAAEAKKNRCLVNVTDAPSLGNFSVAGTYHAGKLHFSVATGGNPRLTHLLLEDLRQEYGADMAAFSSFLEEARSRVKLLLPTAAQRQIFWQNTLTSQLLQEVKKGRLQQAKEIIIHAIDRIGLKS